MEIGPDLAEKVLSADLRNIIQKVQDGGTLTSAERALIRKCAMRASPQQQVRVAALWQKWACGGRLAPDEIAELASTGDIDSTSPGDDSPSSVSTPLILSSEPARDRLSGERLAAWAKQYGRGPRTLRRWHDDGAPLDDPAQMPAWWDAQRAAGKIHWRCPDEVLKAAEEARAALPSDSPSQPGAGAPEAVAAIAPEKLASINLEDYDPEEGDRLRELKQVQAARFSQLKDALKAGNDTSLLESKYIKLSETIDRIETRAIERMKKKGLYLLRVAVQRDIDNAVETLRQMRESMVSRVLEVCPNLSHEQRDQVAAAIVRVRSDEDRALCRLETLRSPADVVVALAA